MAAFIEPKLLKGFRDFLPPAEMIRRHLTEKIEASFRSFGFVPIDTPALEYAEILLGKGGGETEKQIYRFKDNGERDVALRFDLTVPFARFVALHQAELTFPLKRYHIGKVWRGENAQRGRYREFTQCDFDIIGSDSPAADFEIILMIRAVLLNLGAGVSIRINHRGLFNRFLAHIGQREKSVEVLRTVDKIAKTGHDETAAALAAITGDAHARKILDFTAAVSGENFEETLNRITELSGGPSSESERLRLIRRFMNDTVSGGNSAEGGDFILDPSITRGLDYYTGVVFETFLTELPDIGSICSGGRYDNLAGLYSKNTAISGVGSSIGLDRMIAALENLNKLPAAASYAAAAIACLKPEDSGLYQALAQQFRQQGVPCEVFLEASSAGTSSAESAHPADAADPISGKQLVKQFVLAEKKGLRWMIIPGAEPLHDSLTLRDLAGRQNREGLSCTEAVQIIQRGVL
ncbi:MAG: histidine--tRNA ligase [Treponema sp.]|jgi:histidyl-tRNA synthetase|nr:histidine--tRNA ligase [Treponema sp.]